jgi:hypothetical protein
MIALTVPEVRRLIATAIGPLTTEPRRALVRMDAQPPGPRSWFHHRARLARDQDVSMKPLAS